MNDFYFYCSIVITVYFSIGLFIRYLRGFTVQGGGRKRIAYPCSDNKNFFLCLHVDISSDLELRRLSFGDVMMWYFSERQRLQRLVRGEYGRACCTIVHSIL